MKSSEKHFVLMWCLCCGRESSEEQLLLNWIMQSEMMHHKSQHVIAASGIICSPQIRLRRRLCGIWVAANDLSQTHSSHTQFQQSHKMWWDHLISSLEIQYFVYSFQQFSNSINQSHWHLLLVFISEILPAKRFRIQF